MSKASRGGERQVLLVFRLPENPSRYRVSVWRRLKRAGARVVHRSLFVLPDTPLNRLRAADLAHDVENWGGTAWVFVGDSLVIPSPKVRRATNAFGKRSRRAQRRRGSRK